jgi:hypothetical protein
VKKKFEKKSILKQVVVGCRCSRSMHSTYCTSMAYLRIERQGGGRHRIHPSNTNEQRVRKSTGGVVVVVTTGRVESSNGCGNRQSLSISTRRQQCICVCVFGSEGGGGRQRRLGVIVSVYNMTRTRKMGGGATFTTLIFVLSINILIFCDSKQI